MDQDEQEAAHKAVLAMLESFHHSGANRFDLTITNIQGAKIRFRQNILYNDLHHTLPSLLDNEIRSGHNVILRPRGPGVHFIQLDDLDQAKIAHVQETAFLSLETSPGNFQAWIAIPEGSADEDFARRLRKGTGADPSASGATRVAGSLNFKDKYAPDFPRIKIMQCIPGHIVTPQQLTAKGLVAAPEKAAKPVVTIRSRPGPHSRKWPDYQRCIQGAPPNSEKTGPDVSRADFAWCMTAIDWGFAIKETATRLMHISTKAQENGEKYALLTAQNAAAAVERRKGQQRG